MIGGYRAKRTRTKRNNVAKGPKRYKRRSSNAAGKVYKKSRKSGSRRKMPRSHSRSVSRSVSRSGSRSGSRSHSR